MEATLHCSVVSSGIRPPAGSAQFQIIKQSAESLEFGIIEKSFG
jgi:hypothetical protein